MSGKISEAVKTIARSERMRMKDLSLRGVCRFERRHSVVSRLIPYAAIVFLILSVEVATSAECSKASGSSFGAVSFSVRPKVTSTDDLARARILGLLAASRAQHHSKGTCFVTVAVDPRSELVFESVQLGTNADGSCSSSKCADDLETIRIPHDVSAVEFERSKTAAINAMRIEDQKEPNFLNAGVRYATQAAYREIYPADSIERRLFGLTELDFADVSYENFSQWRSSRSLEQVSPSEIAQRHSDAERASVDHSSEVVLQYLNLNRHGWGHKSIIMIQGGFQASGQLGIANKTLRSICPPAHAGGIGADAWNDVRSKLTCARESVGSLKWLILFSERRPVAEISDLDQFAQKLLGELRSDPNGARRLIVVNFLGQ